jgi:Ca2+-binding RTX toxin-like protein
VGEPLEAGAARWSGGEPLTFTYAWQRCDSSGLNCVPIAGAVDSTYTPVAADVGSTLKASITAASQYPGGGNATTTTNTSGKVGIARPYTETLPTIAGTAAVGSQLTASTALGSWSGASSPLAYQWRRCGTDGGNCVSIGGATSSTYTLTAADQGSTLRVDVTGTNAGGSSVISSLATAVVAAASGGGGGGTVGGGSSGGGGGGGSSSVTIALTPATQTVASGGTATWTVAVTNTGGAYLYAVGVRDAAAPSCGIPSSFGDTASFMPPGVTISYTCSLAGITSSLTNSAVATATTGPGDILTQTATATVTVQGAAAAGPSPPAGSGRSGGTTAPHPKPLRAHGKTINGTAKANHLTGTNAADVINGRGGNDIIRGLAGNDTIDGGPGNDTIDGGAGNDKLTGGAGRDRVSGGAGADTIYVRDHVRDVVSCGSGTDTVYADRIDAVARDCEHVHRSGAAL